MNRILDTLRARLGVGEGAVEIPEDLKAEPADIVFTGLQERREPVSPMLGRAPSMDQPVLPQAPDPLGGLQGPMTPPTPSQPARPAAPQAPGGPAMDMSSLFDF